jgi:hypothetical protein
MVHGTPNTITTRDKREHMRKRKPLAHALSDSAQRNYEAIIVNEARRFCDVLTKSSSDDPYSSSPAASSGWGRAKNMSHWCKKFRTSFPPWQGLGLFKMLIS